MPEPTPPRAGTAPHPPQPSPACHSAAKRRNLPRPTQRRSLLQRRPAQALLACLLTLVMLGADDAEARFNRIGHNMVCQCSCGQILLECNHIGCPVSPVMINELRQQIASTSAETPIFNWFVNKYGAVVLAAPIRGGFDTVAWIAPIAVFLLGTVGTAFVVRTWTRRHHATLTTASNTLPLSPEHAALRDRIRQETEY